MRTLRQAVTSLIPALGSKAKKPWRHGLAGVSLLPMRCAWCMEWMVVMDPGHQGNAGGVSHGLCDACRSELEQSKT